MDDAVCPAIKSCLRTVRSYIDETLMSLELCGEGLFWFGCFPVKIENSDGAPARAVAWIE